MRPVLLLTCALAALPPSLARAQAKPAQNLSPAAREGLRLAQEGCQSDGFDPNLCDKAIARLQEAARRDPNQVDVQIALSQAYWNSAHLEPETSRSAGRTWRPRPRRASSRARWTRSRSASASASSPRRRCGPWSREGSRPCAATAASRERPSYPLNPGTTPPSPQHEGHDRGGRSTSPTCCCAYRRPQFVHRRVAAPRVDHHPSRPSA